MAKRRITRKQIKAKDEFLTRAEKTTEWILEKGWKKVLLALGVAALFMLVVIIVGNIGSKKVDEASLLYSSGLQKFSEALLYSDTEFIQNKDKLNDKGTQGTTDKHGQLHHLYTGRSHKENGSNEVYTTGNGGKTEKQNSKCIKGCITRAVDGIWRIAGPHNVWRIWNNKCEECQHDAHDKKPEA